MIITRKKQSEKLKQSKKYTRGRQKNCKSTLCHKPIKYNSKVNHKLGQRKSYKSYKSYKKNSLIGGADNSNIKISINYPSIELEGNIENGSNLTVAHKAGKLINAPIVNLERLQENQKYLVIMYDLDAPNGEGHADNQIHVHWIFIQNGSNTVGRKTILEYKQPNPPRGKHRYIFNIYNANGIADSDIKSLVDSGNTFNNNVINKLSKIEHNQMMYIVSASNEF
jgi:phosphatidylethanolamine-binding protein (PEBP) family uncharacterized protein